MNDTITLHLKNLKRHNQIVNVIRLIPTGFRKYEGNQQGHTLNHEIIIHEVSQREKEKFIYRTQFVPSSHYNLIITVDKHKDAIIFNFSLPKYFYGHNIAQAVMNVNEIKFDMTNFDFDYALNNGFQRLIRYIKTFFSNEFGGCFIDYDLLQLKRLDYCYNQIFQTKIDALTYLEMQKSIKKKYLRETSTYSNNYDTSIFFSNEMYSVKIYHKGTEYAKKDAKEHEKINTLKKRLVFDIGYLQDFADKTLRYEITIRPLYMSYLFNKFMFRKKSKQFTTFKSIHAKIRSINTKFDNKKFFETDDRKIEMLELIEKHKNKKDKNTNLKIFQFLYLHYYKIAKEDISEKEMLHMLNKFYIDFDKLMNTRRDFYFSLNSIDRNNFYDDNENNDNKFITHRPVLFNEELFIIMGKKLKEFIFDMRIEQRTSVDSYLRAIDIYNDKIDNHRNVIKGLPTKNKDATRAKIDKCKLGLIIIAMENQTLESLQKKIHFSRATMHRYTTQLKEIGYTKNSVSKIPFHIPEIDFKNYYIETFTNSRKFFQVEFFRLENFH